MTERVACRVWLPPGDVTTQVYSPASLARTACTVNAPSAVTHTREPAVMGLKSCFTCVVNFRTLQIALNANGYKKHTSVNNLIKILTVYCGTNQYCTSRSDHLKPYTAMLRYGLITLVYLLVEL